MEPENLFLSVSRKVLYIFPDMESSNEIRCASQLFCQNLEPLFMNVHERQKLYNKIINKKINLGKRSESCNKVINSRKIIQIENKVKKDCPIVKNISPNIRHIKFNNLFENEKIQKYKYIKKIPIGNKKILIQMDNFNKISPNDNSIIKTQTETEKIKKGKINIIPLNNVSKHNKNKKANNILQNIKINQHFQ